MPPRWSHTHTRTDNAKTLIFIFFLSIFCPFIPSFSFLLLLSLFLGFHAADGQHFDSQLTKAFTRLRQNKKKKKKKKGPNPFFFFLFMRIHFWYITHQTFSLCLLALKKKWQTPLDPYRCAVVLLNVFFSHQTYSPSSPEPDSVLLCWDSHWPSL